LLLKEDMPPIARSQDISIQDAIDKINSLTGLGGVKQQVKAIIDYINMEKIRSQASGEPVSNLSLHFVFSGNPGTGKTTVARLLAQVFKSLGLLSKGNLVEIDRSALVAGYVGQTAIKTNEKIDESMGGILFIDEAYTLTPKGSENDFGKEAIDILLKRMEDDRGKFIVIAAGYKNEMEQFINANPGLPSRFTRTIHFDDYSDDEMTQIFTGIAKKSGRVLSNDALAALPAIFSEIRSKEMHRFANGRTARNLFEHSLEKMAMRLASRGLSATDSNDINTIILQDII